MERTMSAWLRRTNGTAMRGMLLLALAVCGLPGLAAYAATHGPASKAAGAEKISIARRGGKALLPAPGAPPVPLAVRLSNSSAVPRYVTKLTVTVTRSLARCRAEANLRLVQSNVSSLHPIRVPGGGSIPLPAQGISAPTIQLVNRPVSQDGCKGARFPLRIAFTDRAHG
jgi:hypothetical protein